MDHKHKRIPLGKYKLKAVYNL